LGGLGIPLLVEPSTSSLYTKSGKLARLKSSLIARAKEVTEGNPSRHQRSV
jgi:hypothetical protein